MSETPAARARRPQASAPDRPAPFSHPEITASGARRASVRLNALDTLWFNTGTLCNLTCVNCYIESSPSNDRLVYLSAAEVAVFLDEIQRDGLPTRLIGFTGGEPMMNPELPAMLDDALSRGFRAIVLTNAMRPMMKVAGALTSIRKRFGNALELRVSLDHYTKRLHETERGARTWKPTLAGIGWLAAEGFNLTVAGRTMWGEPQPSLRRGYGQLFRSLDIDLDVDDPARLVLFPEMEATAEVPEITTECWQILGKSPDEVMCASSRMVVKRRGAPAPVVLSCTLLPYEREFELGPSLSAASRAVHLNHPHCARFCVLGGGACSR